ncbi:putative ribonuclease H-like domain-containing protein [Tanacetum coccineum]
MDNVRPRASYSPIKRSYYTKLAFRPKNLKQDVKTSGVKNMTTAGTRAVVNTGKGKMNNDLKKSRWVWRPKGNYMDHESKEKGSFILKKFEYVDPKGISKSVDHAVVDSGCSSHMTGNKAYLSDYEDYNGGFVAFGSDPKGARYSPSANAGELSYQFVLLGDRYLLMLLHSLHLNLPTDPNMEESIDYDEVFAPVARIEAIRLFLAFASYMGFTVYQMDVKSAFLYGTIEEEVYVHQPPGFVDPTYPNKVYKVIKALYGLHQAPRAWYETLSSFLMENGFRRVNQQPDGIFISQDKYVADILKKFDFLSIKTATTPIESNKPLVKEEDGVDVDVHIYRSMIGSLMYLTASRPDIMFVICAYARFQVTQKASHLNAVKRIFRYLKHQPKLGLWYPRDSPFELEAYSDSDYGGASLDRKSTTCGCQYLGRRLISWQCKKQTIVANSTTEVEYVATANCCRQVLWIQNQMMDYGFNFMNTKIHINNESTISVIKNPVAHLRTKHIEIRFHFIRDCYEKRLIEVIKIHTDHNVADLLTKGFDVTRFNFLVVSIGMLNL